MQAPSKKVSWNMYSQFSGFDYHLQQFHNTGEAEWWLLDEAQGRTCRGLLCHALFSLSGLEHDKGYLDFCQLKHFMNFWRLNHLTAQAYASKNEFSGTSSQITVSRMQPNTNLFTNWRENEGKYGSILFATVNTTNCYLVVLKITSRLWCQTAVEACGFWKRNSPSPTYTAVEV